MYQSNITLVQDCIAPRNMPLIFQLYRSRTIAIAALLLCVWWAASSVWAADEKTAALAEINQTRVLVGLPPVSLNANLDQAAQSHANYLQANLDGISHDETPGLPFFTGASPSERVTAADYTWRTVSEVISGGITSGQQAVQHLVKAIYHRLGILAPAVAEVGIGLGTASGKLSNVVIDFAATTSNAVTPPSGWLGTYPVQGQTGVDPAFNSDDESPDPVPHQNRVGYPVSLHGGATDKLSVTRFGLKPVGGAPLNVKVLTDVPAHVAAIVPLTVLNYGTPYQADFVGMLNGQPVERSWIFTTVAYSTMTVDVPYQRVGVGQVARIVVSGGNQDVSQSGINWTTGPAPQVVKVSSGIFEVRASSPVEATLTFSDQDGQTQEARVSFVNPASETTTTVAGWNLLGNSLQTPMVVLDRFGHVDAPVAGVTDKVISVWKWLPTEMRWAYYSPTLTAQALAAETVKVGYAVLDRIEPGEGYWVNTKTSISFPTRTGLPSPTVPTVLTKGWNLLGVGEAMTPAAFDKTLGNPVMIPSASKCMLTECWEIAGGLVTTPSIKSLWTWDATARKWRFYGSILALQGGTALSDYAATMGYLPYDMTENKYLHTGVGFWINK